MLRADLPFPVTTFRRQLLTWFARHGRDLPWRHTRDPYAILVSEFMLQQTQVATVLPYYARWLKRFPDFTTLARASESEVLHAWQGLGYYARARNLHASAREVVTKFQGNLPEDASHIAGLPGVGRYTANAIATFAFDQSLPIVEANIARLFARLTNYQQPIDTNAGRDFLWLTAKALLPRRNPSRYNSALMDLGAIICLPRKPRCPLCPVKTLCRAQEPDKLPLKKARPPTIQLTEKHTFTRDRNRILLEQATKRWRGMWILPQLADRPQEQPLLSLDFPFTRHRITLEVYHSPPILAISDNQRWFSLPKLASVPLPSPHRRALDRLLACNGKVSAKS